MQVLTGLHSNNSEIARFNTWTVKTQHRMINILKNNVEMNVSVFVLMSMTKGSQPTTEMLGIKTNKQ